MKKTIVLSVVPLLLSLLAVGCSRDKVLTEGLRYCESVLAYDGGLLIANFGSDELNPLNSEGKGYILYYDGFDDFPWPGRNKARRGIFFCDLQNHTRGAYAATPYETKEKSALYPYNPIGIPGTNWIFYLQDSDESPRKSQLVVRPKLTPAQAEKAAQEYQKFIQSNTKNE